MPTWEDQLLADIEQASAALPRPALPPRLTLTKQAVASRQIDAAIRMRFAAEDTVAVYSVAACATGILRGLMDARGPEALMTFYREILTFGIQALSERSDVVAATPRRRQILERLNRVANYLKHADRDAEQGLDTSTVDVDAKIMEAVALWLALGFEPTISMNAFFEWYKLCHPCLAEERALTTHGHVDSLPEEARLAIGREFLALGERKARGDTQPDQQAGGSDDEAVSS